MIFCILPIPQSFPLSDKRFPSNPDHFSPHIVRMTEWLLYLWLPFGGCWVWISSQDTNHLGWHVCWLNCKLLFGMDVNLCPLFLGKNIDWGLTNERPTSCHLLFYFTYYVLNMFRTLIYPSSGACDCVDELPHRSSCSQFVVCWSFCCGWFLVVFVLQASVTCYFISLIMRSTCFGH